MSVILPHCHRSRCKHRFPLVRVKAQHRVVEHVEDIHAELRFHAFGDGEVFESAASAKNACGPR